MRFQMTTKSVLVRPQGLRPRTRAPTCPLFATPLWIRVATASVSIKVPVLPCRCPKDGCRYSVCIESLVFGTESLGVLKSLARTLVIYFVNRNLLSS